ncbi:MAG: hypothetical protein GY797_19635 [Deltaproteobacteria bacterium]|nr:hypothetical protein [Deltaproteobacteria bacterium]
MSKRKIHYMNYVVGASLGLAMVCFAIALYARHKHHEFPELWIDGVVGMGMGGVLFFMSAPFLGIFFVNFRLRDFVCIKRLFLFLGCGAFTTLSVILFSIGLERFLSDYPF